MAAKPQPKVLKDGTIRWRLPYRRAPGGKITYETFDTPEDAIRFGELVDKIGGQAAYEARTAITAAPRGALTLAEWFERHLDTLAASRTPGTIEDYRRMAARTWLPTLGPLPLAAITRDAVVRWVAEQRKVETAQSRARRAAAVKRQKADPSVVVPQPVTYSPKSIANAQRLLSSVLSAAVDADLIERNVARGVKLPSDHERREMVLITHNDFARLLDAIPEHYRPLVALLAGTGLRWGEATALQPEDFDLDAAAPTVRVTRAWKKGASGPYLGSPKSKKGVRTVTLGRALVDMLRPVVEATARGALVFTSPEGGRAQSQHFAYRVWRPALERAGLDHLRVHDLRHTHASWLIAAGVSLPVIQRRLGHESIKTTVDVYGHLAPDAHAGAAEAADLAMSSALPQIEG